MTASTWQRVKELLADCLEAAPGDRSALLESACGGDAELRAHVERMLARADGGGDFLDEPALAESIEGQRFGVWRIDAEIGAGGMGRVYRAHRDDGQFEQAAAVKVIKRGMDTDAILRRFRGERQILASLDHPNIARFLDGGATPDDRPYFVMEFLEGEPIDRYAAGRSLAVRDRLELFLAACAAVSYAHQRLVVHRDIKPGNLLVTSEGVPKLLDFGIAKLLNAGDAEAAMTMTGAPLLTPEYASPEQRRGEALTTATDVFSLGVLLHKVLTGEHPEPRAKPTESRDLDNILAKCMEPDAARRYGSVDQLAADVRRFLEGRPVLARPQTARYRLARFLQRNKLAVGAAALIALSLLGGMAGTLWQARRAEERFNEVRQLANAMIFEVDGQLEGVAGATKARGTLLRRALSFLDRLTPDPSATGRAARELRWDLAAAYIRLGDILGNAATQNLGLTAEAAGSYEKAERLLKADSSDDGSDPRGAVLLGRVGFRLKGMDRAERSVRLLEGARARHPQNLDVQMGVSTAYTQMGSVLVDREDYAGALPWRRKVVEFDETLHRRFPQSAPILANLALSTKRFSALLTKLDRFDEALPVNQRALELDRMLLGNNPRDVSLRMAESLTLADRALILRNQKKPAEALENYRQALRIREEVFAADPVNQRSRSLLASVLWRMAYPLTELRRVAEAEASIVRSIALLEGADEKVRASRVFRSALEEARTAQAECRALAAKAK